MVEVRVDTVKNGVEIERGKAPTAAKMQLEKEDYETVMTVTC